IHSSTSRVSSLTMLGSATAAFMFARSTNMPAAPGSIGKLLPAGGGGAGGGGEPAGGPAVERPGESLSVGYAPYRDKQEPRQDWPKPLFIDCSYTIAVSLPDNPAAPKMAANLSRIVATPSGVEVAR